MTSSSDTPSPRKGGSGKRSTGKRSTGKRAPGGGARGGGRGRPPAEDDPVARLRKPLERVLDRLPETQREVLEWRMGLKDGHPHDLADTARQLGLSMAEAREIEQRAFSHIREAIPLEQLAKYLES